MPTVITRDADRPHIFLDSSAHDVVRRAMIAQIDDFNPVTDQVEVDRIDRAIVSVTDRDSG
jgi:hypothetical protein